MKSTKKQIKNSQSAETSVKKVKAWKVILIWFAAIIAVSCVVAFSLWTYETGPMERNAENEKICKVKISEGTSVFDAAQLLEDEGLIRSAKVFYYIARLDLFDLSRKFTLKSGQYTLKNTMSMKDIYREIQVGSPEYLSVHIPEGLTIKKTGRLLEKNLICSYDDFVKACHNKELLKEYDIPADNFEGYLFPDTYFFTKNMNAEDVVRKLADNFQYRISTIDAFKDKTAKEIFEIVTLASIVEREYKVASEAPRIASVFVNRLNHDIGLYSCATIEYIITEILDKPHPERIYYADLKIDNPYNTYMWEGLPPGPISNPGLVALKASAEPEDTDYYFFVLTNPDEGTHSFSKTFDQHKAAENTATVSK